MYQGQNNVNLALLQLARSQVVSVWSHDEFGLLFVVLLQRETNARAGVDLLGGVLVGTTGLHLRDVQLGLGKSVEGKPGDELINRANVVQVQNVINNERGTFDQGSLGQVLNRSDQNTTKHLGISNGEIQTLVCATFECFSLSVVVPGANGKSG